MEEKMGTKTFSEFVNEIISQHKNIERYEITGDVVEGWARIERDCDEINIYLKLNQSMAEGRRLEIQENT